jgi:hypothetical protein
LNALFSFIPADERIIITEETPEISLPHRHQLRLVANRDMGITLKDLVYDTLRMRPDRMVVGEVRNKEEAEALFDVLLAGQARGSYATFHAQSAEDALSRLQSFGVRKDDLSSIDCILVQRRMLMYDAEGRRNREVRKVVEIAETSGAGKDGGGGKDGESGLGMIYSACGAHGRGDHGKNNDWKGMQHCRLLGKMASSFGLSREGMAGELERRERVIMGVPGAGAAGGGAAGGDFDSFYKAVQKDFYGLDG